MKTNRQPGLGPLVASIVLTVATGPFGLVVLAIWLALTVRACWPSIKARIARSKAARVWTYDVEIARLRAWHSAKVLAGFMAIWTVLAGTVFWTEPVLIWQIVRHGHIGLGHVTLSAYLAGVLAWLVPLFVYELFAHWTDATIAYEDRHITGVMKRLGPGEYHNAYNPMAPVRRAGATDFRDFTQWHYSKAAMAGTAFGATVAGIFAGMYVFGLQQGPLVALHRYQTPVTTPMILHAVAAGAIVAYLVVAVVAYLFVVTMQSDFDGSSMFLPWTQPWTLLYLVATAPVAAYQVMAVIRLVLPPVAKVLAELIFWPSRSAPLTD